jgi:hypothetical protein
MIDDRPFPWFIRAARQLKLENFLIFEDAPEKIQSGLIYYRHLGNGRIPTYFFQENNLPPTTTRHDFQIRNPKTSAELLDLVKLPLLTAQCAVQICHPEI